MLNSEKLGLLGQLLDTKLSTDALEKCDICDIAEVLKHKILHRLLVVELDPDVAVEIDGEIWDRAGIVGSLRSLYNWADTLCAREEGSVVAFSSNARCGSRTC